MIAQARRTAGRDFWEHYRALLQAVEAGLGPPPASGAGSNLRHRRADSLERAR